jgi:hypothetical protein
MLRTAVLLVLLTSACASEPPPADEPLPLAPLVEQADVDKWVGAYVFDEQDAAREWTHRLTLHAPDTARRVLAGTYEVDEPDGVARQAVFGAPLGRDLALIAERVDSTSATSIARPGDTLFVFEHAAERPGLLSTLWRTAARYGDLDQSRDASFQRLPTLVLEAGGLRLINSVTGSARPLPFGMTQDNTLDALSRVRAAPDQATNDECGAGPLAFALWPDGLTLLFQDDRFVGWTAGANDTSTAPLTTAAGVGPTSTWAEVQAVYTAELYETTLGTEFRAGDLFGLLTGTHPTARVDLLWSGTTCFFR